MKNNNNTSPLKHIQIKKQEIGILTLRPFITVYRIIAKNYSFKFSISCPRVSKKQNSY